MRRKVKSKARMIQSKLKSKAKFRANKTVSSRKLATKTHKRILTTSKTKRVEASSVKKIVRIMGQGQFTVDAKTLKKLSDIDTAMVELVGRERSDDAEFKKRLTEMSEMVMKNGKPRDPKEIIKSDIILPSADLSIDEAKKLFKGDGVIPDY